jgi:hypothetical protein
MTHPNLLIAKVKGFPWWIARVRRFECMLKLTYGVCIERVRGCIHRRVWAAQPLSFIIIIVCCVILAHNTDSTRVETGNRSEGWLCFHVKREEGFCICLLLWHTEMRLGEDSGLLEFL